MTSCPQTSTVPAVAVRPAHVPVLDGLRAIAVLMVLWVHVPQTTPGYPQWLAVAAFFVGPGGFGVELFFVLSGFLITRILLAERAAGTPLRWFMLRRALRIFPIYYLLLLVMLPFRPAAEIGWCAVYLSNFASMIWPDHGPLGHTWSLCVEEHFYLLWPPAIAFLPERLAYRALAFVVLPAAVVGAWLVCEHVPESHAMIVVRHGSPFRFLGLGAGCLLAFHERELLAAPRRALTLAIALLGAAVALHPYVLYVRPMLHEQPPLLRLELGALTWLVQSAALCTALVLLALLAGRRFPRNPLTAAPLRAIGRISYGLYLYHMPVFHSLFGTAPTGSRVLLALALTFAAAIASYVLIEAPLLRRAARWRAAPRGP